MVNQTIDIKVISLASFPQWVACGTNETASLNDHDYEIFLNK